MVEGCLHDKTDRRKPMFANEFAKVKKSALVPTSIEYAKRVGLLKDGGIFIQLRA